MKETNIKAKKPPIVDIHRNKAGKVGKKKGTDHIGA